MPIFEGLTDYLGRTIRPILGKYAENDYREVKVDADGKLDVASAITIGDVNNKAYNGATWDNWRNNTEVELLASAARTSNTQTATQTNYNARGVMLFLNLTVAPATADYIYLLLVARSSTTGILRIICNGDHLLGSGGAQKYLMAAYPGVTNAGAGSEIGKVNDICLPRTWHAMVVHSSAESFTYSLSASPII